MRGKTINRSEIMYAIKIPDYQSEPSLYLKHTPGSQIKRVGYSFVPELSDAWHFSSRFQAVSKAHILDRHFGFSPGTCELCPVLSGSI